MVHSKKFFKVMSLLFNKNTFEQPPNATKFSQIHQNSLAHIRSQVFAIHRSSFSPPKQTSSKTPVRPVISFPKTISSWTHKCKWEGGGLASGMFRGFSGSGGILLGKTSPARMGFKLPWFLRGCLGGGAKAFFLLECFFDLPLWASRLILSFLLPSGWVSSAFWGWVFLLGVGWLWWRGTWILFEGVNNVEL